MSPFRAAPKAIGTSPYDIPVTPAVLPFSPDAPHVSLPPLPAGKFVGRTRELAQVLSIIERRSSQLLTILGPGGVGKTRLAVTAAWELAPSFRDGVFFISFAAADRGSVYEFIARHLSVPNAAGEPWTTALRDALRTREVLLILDNCEPVIEGFDELPGVLNHCPGVVVMASSQEALRLRGEQELWLQPLTLPEEVTTGAEAVGRSGAGELFVLRAQRTDPEFELTDDNAPDIAAIVTMLDGLPLAIELAAAQTRHLPPAALRHRLEKAMPSLSGGSRDLPERQQSLMSMAMWSLGLLTPRERDRFLQLAVLQGHFTPETAAAVVEGLSPVEAWEVLLSFADKSLIKRVDSDDRSAARFFMLQTVHAVTLQLLQQRPDSYVDACRRHADAYLKLAREASSHWHDREQLAWLQRMELEHGNIQVIFERAMTDGRLTKAALELAEPMFWFWYTRGYHAWALPRIEHLLRDAPDSVPADLRGSAHVTAGWLAFKHRHVHRAEQHFRQGATLLPDPASPPALRGSIGEAYVVSFEGKKNVEALDQLRTVVERATGNPAAAHELAAGHFGIGLTEYFHRHLETARAAFDASLGVSRASDDRQSIAMNLIYLAHIDRLEGHPRDAIRNLQEVVPIFLEVADQANIVLGLDVVVSTLVEIREFDLARRIVVVNERMRRTMGLVRPPLEQPDFNDAIRRIRAGLGLDASQPLETTELQLSLNDVIEAFLALRPVAEDGSEQPATAPPEAVLSGRELEVLQLIASGMTSSEIAKSLYVSPHTVKRHMANIREKLGVRSQAAAVAALKQFG